MKVIGAGFGRTGTKSLQLALHKLGLGKCYHMEELFRNPQGYIHWKAAMEGKRVNWDELFKGYQAIVDFPGSMYYQSLAEYYPEAKVILGLRDPESWYESARSTIYSFDPGIIFKLKIAMQAIYKPKARNLLQVFQLNDQSLWGKFFEGKFEDKDYTINKYLQHIETVKKTIPAHRLLLHDNRQGWEPLCKFLDKDIPAEPYPSSNKREDFGTWAKSVVKESLQMK